MAATFFFVRLDSWRQFLDYGKEVMLFSWYAHRGGGLDVRGADGDSPGRRQPAGRGRARLLGGGPGQPQGGGAGRGLPAVRVLRAGLDRGLAGPGDVAGPAAAAGRDAHSRARGYRGGILRRGGEPGAAVGAAPAGRRPGRAARRPGSWVGRDRDRRVRAGVLRQSV